MFQPDNAVLLVIDVQGNLAGMMHEKNELLQNLQRLIKGARILEIPILWTEQNPRGLGPTVPELGELLAGLEPIDKLSFSCAGSERFVRELKATGRQQVLIAGIEAHVCVYQTTVDLVDLGFEVEVVADAVSSRVQTNKQIGLDKMARSGARLTSTEMALFELLRVAEGPKFKQILAIVK